ncbi:Phosphate system positive regulatory protein PHO81 [Hondaea fermentalgiana]|uniref:Phosphate system positive regulatory protein PHO81 n=1 Tax=Hondaea fermentalgiana TaxID=2315210 RepID=A0A2R5GVR6_9STRA|nr:Phosphate system positive regulatory protein PHO81 [Hondaea fermentalgiana]|eukprot:GBG34419.1 Phosphate system positive regulatory protein PHO81 [Hondaea fermentalgiana]
MKFGKRLEDDLAEPRWEEHYVRYRALKKMIKVLSLLGKDADSRLLEEALMVFPRKKKKKLLRGLQDAEMNCTLCKRWSLFSSIMLEDVAHVRGFLSSTVHGLQVSFYNNIQPNVLELLNELRVKGEPNLYPGCKEVNLLARFAVFLDTLEALRRFVVVNDMAMEKAIKKFKKRVLSVVDVESAPCGEHCAKHMLRRRVYTIGSSDSPNGDGTHGTHKPGIDSYSSSSSEDEGEEEMRGHGSSNVASSKGDEKREEDASAAPEMVLSYKPLLRKLQSECSAECETIAKLEAAAEMLASRTMVSSSVFHDFILDQRTQLHAQRQQEKLARVEARSKMLTRLTRHIDMENQMRPASFLMAGVILPLVTLAITYYISSTIYIDDEMSMTIFDEKGFFISASLDVAPASNIGTLGLTTTLSMLSVIIFVKHKLVKKQLRGRNWMRTHRIATAFGLLSTFCGNGVAAFQHNAHAAAHNTFAALFFVFGMIHVVMETLLDLRFSLSMPMTRKARLLISVLLIVSVMGFLGPMTYVLVERPPKEVGRFYKKIAASFEITAFACFVFWFGSYYSVLKASQFKLHVVHRVRLDSSDNLANLRQSLHHHRQNSMDSLDSMDSDLGSVGSVRSALVKQLGTADDEGFEEARSSSSAHLENYMGDREHDFEGYEYGGDVEDDYHNDEDDDGANPADQDGKGLFRKRRSIVRVESNPRYGIDLDSIAFHEARQNSGKLKVR